ncbi:MAG: xanthine dehydrogenase family protein molybdopterin-binding subunit [Solirubrobacterales bacterium]|nr:xanthine dehydrogenase family protein molybdopterin-binding subunit [Solirubrobacterales bacterium]
MALVGEPRDRIDAAAKVTGGARYSADIAIDGVAHAVFATSTIAAGRIVRIDVTEAERAAGVIAVFTYETMPRLAREPVFDFPNIGTKIAFLQDERIFYAGQPVAMIVAETREQAASAAERIQIEYAADAPVATLADGEAEARDLEMLYGALPAPYARGDIEEGLRQADVRLSERYSFPAQRHHPIELSSTTAVWDGSRVTVYETTQGVSMIQLNLCNLLNLPPENVRVVSRFVGGAFGAKGTFWFHTAYTVLVARELARPVQLVITRDQMTTTTGYREQQRQELTLGATREGKLTAIRHHKLAATSMVDDFTEPSCTGTTLLYACDNVDTSYRLAPTNAMMPNYMRGVGQSSGLFALESALDELALQLDLDPIEIRLRNHADVDPRSGAPWTSKSLKECYARGAEMIGWHTRDRAIGSMREDGWLIGYGMGTALHPVPPRERTELRLRLHASGHVLVECGGQDIGTGTYTVAALVVADVLGLPVESVEVKLGDTDLPRTGNSVGATTAASVSSAAHIAATGLLARLSALAVADPRSPLHEAEPDAISASGGRLIHQDRRGDAFADVLRRQQLMTLDVIGEWNPATGSASAAGVTQRIAVGQGSSFSHGAWFAIVGVRPQLGLVRVRRLAGAFAAGRILNEKTAASQMRGGAIIGIGQALLEATTTDRETARILNPGLNEYLIPAHADVPLIDIAFIEEHDENINVLGVKGIGELPVSGVAPAIANAVHHATGRRIRDLPIRPETLL